MDIAFELKKDFKDMSPALQRGLEAGLLAAAESIQYRVKKNLHGPDARNTGKLAQSITVKVEKEKKQATVGTNLVYGPAIEYGTKPHFPPVEPLEEWARLKLHVEGIGFLIAQKISKFGTVGTPYLRPAEDEGKADASKVFMVEIMKAFK